MANARELLRAERERARHRMTALQREFDAIAEAAGSAGTDDEHDPEGATLAFERQHTAALLGRTREQLAAIDAALDRLEAGRYGECTRCGQPIGKDRLAARPAALTCIQCAARLRQAPCSHVRPCGDGQPGLGVNARMLNFAAVRIALFDAVEGRHRNRRAVQAQLLRHVGSGGPLPLSPFAN